MSKKLIFIIGVCIFTAFFIFKIVQQNSQKSQQLPPLNTNAGYDAPKFELSASESAKVEEVTAKLTEEQSATDDAKLLIQQFDSGEIMSVAIPAQPEASASALKRSGKPTGLQIVSSDYYANIFHLVHLDNTKELCKSLSQTNAHQDLYVKSRTSIKTKASSSTIWDLTSSSGTTLIQLNGCYLDGNDKAWIVDFYIDSVKYQEKYKDAPAEIFNSFSFSK